MYSQYYYFKMRKDFCQPKHTVVLGLPAKIDRNQKVKGLLNVFGIYDHTNDRMFTHCYKHKKSDQFIDFMNKVDSVYDSNIKRIFVVLDNGSIHKSKKTREALAHHHPRIVPVFLPTKLPKLNLTEVRWMWMQRKAIDNSTFGNESDIKQAVSEWTEDYNNMHKTITGHTLQKQLRVFFLLGFYS
jgi:transposase